MFKRCLFAAVVVVAVALVIEVVAWLALGLIGEPGSDLSTLKEARTALLASREAATEGSPGGRRPGLADIKLHPYLGYTLDPARSYAHDFGFRGEPAFMSRDANELIVGVTGGSVAEAVWKDGHTLIAHELARVPEFEGREIKVVSLGLWGWKQPQQLAMLAYVLALGGRLDILINLDGVNEIGSDFINSYRRGTFHPIHPSPRAWQSMSSSLASPAVLVAASEVQHLRERRLDRASWMDRFGFTITGNLAWALLDRMLEIRIVAAEENLIGLQEREAAEAVPNLYGEDPPESFEELYRYIADLWMRCSLQIERLAQANGILYYHFLQPSQYVPGSKVLTERERSVAFRETSQWHDHVISGYPSLQSRVPRLRSAGVRAFDLTGLFKDETGPIYVDPCCHMNPRGYELTAVAIGETIVRDLANSSKLPDVQSDAAHVPGT